MTSPTSSRSWSVPVLQGALDSSSIALGSNNEFFIAMTGQGDPVAWVHLISPWEGYQSLNLGKDTDGNIFLFLGPFLETEINSAS